MQLNLRPEEKTALCIHGTTEPAAYDYYLQGRGYLLNTTQSESVANALQMLDRALELDPNYGKAYAARARPTGTTTRRPNSQNGWTGLPRIVTTP